MRTLLYSCAIAAIATASACNPEREEANRVATATLHMGNLGEPKSLDPHIVTGIAEHRILGSLFEGLVNLDPATLEPIPGVAESWSLSDDGTVYTFSLRHDARWSNGDSVTAHDFVYGWRRMLTSSLVAEYAYMLYPLKNAERYHVGEIDDFADVGVKALNDFTLKVVLHSPTPYFLTVHIHYSFFPVHQATIEAFGAMDERDTRWTRPGNMVGNGPFVLTEWAPNDRVVVMKNPLYWDADRVRLNAIRYFPISDANVEERAFRAGELDMTYKLPLAKIAVYQEKHSEVLHIDPNLGIEFIRFNINKPPLNNAKVRRALAISIDRDTLVRRVMKAGQLPATSFVPPHMGYTSDYTLPYDPQEARRLLSDAGYPGGKGFPVLEFLYNSGNNERIYSEAIQNMWKTELGIEVALRNVDSKTWLSSMIGLDYEIARSFWVADYVDPSNFLDMFYAKSGNNRTGFDSPEYENLLRKAATTLELDARNRLYQQAEAILLGQVAIAPVYFTTRAYLKRPEVQGYPQNLVDHIDYRELRLTAQ